MTTLLALFKRPDGGSEALAEFERRYAGEHLPLVAGDAGARSTEVRRVSEALGAETDLVLITAMRFDDRAALDAGWRQTPCGRPAGTCARSRPDSRRCWSSRTPTTSFPERGVRRDVSPRPLSMSSILPRTSREEPV
jgi:hypothetical protein